MLLLLPIARGSRQGILPSLPSLCEERSQTWMKRYAPTESIKIRFSECSFAARQRYWGCTTP